MSERLTQEEVEEYIKTVPDTELTGKIPVKEGIVDGNIDTPSIDELKKMPALKRVEISDSLASLSNDFVFFNHTMLFSRAGLDFDPLREYQGWYGKEDIVNYVMFDRPIFHNFDFVDKSGKHDFLLAFTSIEHWPTIEKAIGKMTVLNRIKNYMFLCESVKVKIPDPKKPVSTIDVYVWNLMGSSCSWVCSGYPVPQLIRKSPDEEAKRLLGAINDERFKS